MGKGDKRTRKGKIFAGSFGKTRQKSKKAVYVPVPAEEKPAKRVKKAKS
jgi:ribosomal small subunit protein bTHX